MFLKYFIRYNVASDISDRVRFLGEDVKKASKTVIKTLAENEGVGGVIDLDERGNYGLSEIICPESVC